MGRDRALLRPLDRLAQVYERLVSPGRQAVLIDLGEFRGFEYYDGIVFDVFAPGIGAELGGGGRYDHLMGRFGRVAASTGFALDVDRLFRAIDLSGDAVSISSVGPQQIEQAMSVSARERRRSPI